MIRRIVLCGPLLAAAASTVLFALLEAFPALIHRLGLEELEYYRYRPFQPDPVLVYRNRPPELYKLVNFWGSRYAAAYGLRVPIEPVRYALDEEGFRNGAAGARPDVLLIGDSFVEYGATEEDTLGGRLARASGLAVRSLAAGGYGPFQYLELFRRYGMTPRPRYAIVAFFEENDIRDVREYLRWQRERKYYGFEILHESFAARYVSALRSAAGHARESLRRAVRPPPQRPLPDLAVLNLAGRRRELLLVDRIAPLGVEERLASREWRETRAILTAFRTLALSHAIAPILLYIPTPGHIYATYSTAESGESWLRDREQQILVRDRARAAMLRLVREIDLRLLDLTPPFSAAAARGALLYHTFDAHWNSVGREVAAEYIAAALRIVPGKPTPPRLVEVSHRVRATGQPSAAAPVAEVVEGACCAEALERFAAEEPRENSTAPVGEREE